MLDNSIHILYSVTVNAAMHVLPDRQTFPHFQITVTDPEFTAGG
jgi:hypothetical protein